MQTIPSASRPLTLSSSIQVQVYALFALAMGLTVVGTVIGMMFAPMLFSSGIGIVLLIAELGLIFTAQLWSRVSPLNYLLFALFPLLSGITFSPYIIILLAQYVNGAQILLNALIATTFLALAAAVFAGIAPNLAGIARGLLLALVGIILFSVLQIFVPSLRTGTAEIVVSGLGIIVFALFTAFDIQRIQSQSRTGANPFLLALSLYLDIYNLLLMVLRLMMEMSGRRR